MQIANALAFLHARQPKIVHLDLKPANIMLTSKDPNTMPTLKLSDFGLATAKRDSQNLHRPAGDRRYTAPEVLVSNASSVHAHDCVVVSCCCARFGGLILQAPLSAFTCAHTFVQVSFEPHCKLPAGENGAACLLLYRRIATCRHTQHAALPCVCIITCTYTSSVLDPAVFLVGLLALMIMNQPDAACCQGPCCCKYVAS